MKFTEKQLREIYSKLYRYALFFTKEYNEACDLVQDTYERMIIKQDYYNGDASLTTWASVIMKNMFIDRCRKAKRIVFVDSLREYDDGCGYNDSCEYVDEKRKKLCNRIYQKMEKQNSICALIILLYSQGFRYKEIAEKLKMKLGTVKTRIWRTRKKMSKYKKLYEKNICEQL